MKRKRVLLDSITIAIILIGCFLFLGIGNITSESMEPALDVGDKVLINKLSYVFSSPQRGDIVAVNKDGKLMIKRVVGVEGDQIKTIDGTLILNDNVLEEPYIEENMETNFLTTYEIPEGCYFLLGDNRENSYDARYWEETYITKDKIIGRVIYCFDSILGSNVEKYQ